MSIVIFIVVAITLQYYKPSVMFDEKGEMREFGVGNEKKTVFYYPIVLIFVAVISFILVNLTYLKYNNII
jgi:hypothetical protein